MSSVKYKNVIQTFFADSANPAFRKCVGVRGLEGSGDNVEAFELENGIKGWAKRAVIVMDQEPQWLFSVGKLPNQLPGLLRNPDLIRVGGDTSKMDTARPQFNEEKHVSGLKKDSFHCEEITRQDLFFVVGHELTPTNGSISNRRWLNTTSIEHIAYCCQGDPDAQLEKFTHNLAVSQTGVLSSETENQAFCFLGDRWPSTLVFVGIGLFSTNQFPIPDSAGEALPAQHGFGLEDTDDIPELICGLARRLLEPGGQNGQGQFLYLAGFDRVIDFTLQDG